VLGDAPRAEALAALLQANGFAATWVSSRTDADGLLSSHEFDLAVIDLAAAQRDPVVLHDLVVELRARRCLVAQREVPLRRKEFDVLRVLVRNRNRLVTRRELMHLVWDEDWCRSSKTIDVTVSGLRRRLREAAGAVAGSVVPPIITLRGLGYRLDGPVEIASPSATAAATLAE
jgi:DNA-binding response OmpR family regulator